MTFWSWSFIWWRWSV